MKGRLPLLAVGSAVAVALVLVFSGGDPRAAGAFFLGPFASGYGFGNLLFQAGLILVAGLGSSLSLRAGAINLGGEGQVYMGAIAGVALSLSCPSLPPFLGAAAACAAALAAGALAGAVSPLMRRLAGSEELISSFILSMALLPLGDWLVAVPLRDPASQLVTTAAPPPAFLPPAFPGLGKLNAASLASLAAIPLCWLFLERSRAGFETKLAGHSPEFALSVGVDVGGRRSAAFVLGAALLGLSGYLATAGNGGRVIRSFSSGLGWNGLACAIIARGLPGRCLPAALLFAYLGAAALSAELRSSVRPELATLVQALILFLAATPALPGRERRRS